MKRGHELYIKTVCGRYVSPDEAAMERHYSYVAPWWKAHVSYDAAPTNILPIMVAAADGALVQERAYWSLLPPKIKTEKDWRYSTFNLRTEKLGDKRSMAARQMKGGRCLVPMSGFYEWPGLEGGKGMIRVYIHPPEDTIWLAAGLCSRYTTDSGHEHMSFGILTQPANEIMQKLHNRGANKHRMPCFIEAGDKDTWLLGDKDEAQDCLTPIESEAMSAYVVTRKAGNKPEQSERLEDVPWDRLAD